MQEYTYSSSIKSTVSDELINTYVIRPLAGMIVRILYPTRISPNQLTLASTVAGFVAAGLYLHGTQMNTVIAGLAITLKDILDSADGQLARAKAQYSRKGRFLDSIGDFFVNFFVCFTITITLVQQSHSFWMILLGSLAFLGLTLRVSYHVFYQTSFLHLGDHYTANRVTEELRDEDMQQDRLTLFLQRFFQAIYGWQDSLMVKLDNWSRGGLSLSPNNDALWYGDKAGLKISGLLGLGTELFVLTICSVANELQPYFYINVGIMNGVWLTGVLYRRSLAKRILTTQESRVP